MRSLLLLTASAGFALAQVPDPAPAPQQSAPAPANNGSNRSGGGGSGGGGGGGGFLGKDAPILNPGTEIVTWDGQNWNINNNRLLEARFEKYLNAPEATNESDRSYQAILSQIMDKLAPGKITPASTDEAFQLLTKASEFDIDAKLSDAIANQVYTAWLAQKSNDRLSAANKGLEDERKRLEWNAKIAAQHNGLSPGGNKDSAANSEWQKQEQLRRDTEMQPITTKLAEINALLKANQLKREVAQLQVKIEFQALIVQLFLQRRFQHVVIGTRFYRSIFADGDSQLRVGEDAKNLFAKTSGLPPTMGTVDSTANEIMRDVREGVSSFKFLLEKDELESASNRLMETFLIGEYLPDVRTLNRDDKREVLSFVQTTNQLISALDVKDYALAEKLVKKLDETAKDFDNSKPMAAIAATAARRGWRLTAASPERCEGRSVTR